jgi:hypothetical protein
MAYILIVDSQAEFRQQLVELDGAGQPYVSKPVAPEAFGQRVRQVLGDAEE